MCIHIVEVWFVIAYGQISSNFDRVAARRTSVVLFTDDTLNKYQSSFTKLGTSIDTKKICFGIAHEQISSVCMDLSARHMIVAGYYRFMLSL